MGDLIVKPAYQFGPTEILTADKLNLLATPVVELALQDPVNDQNFWRNGNFYSSFWVTPSGVSCPVNVWTTNPSYWLIRPQGAAVKCLRSSVVPDLYSLFSGEVQGAVNVSTCEFAQQINGDLSATLRRNCTVSGYLYNGTGLVVSPHLNFYTCDTFNNFATITLRTTVNLQSAPNAAWTFMTSTLDLSTLTNIANGLVVSVLLPAGSLNDPSKYVLFSRLKLQIGEVATEFVDDTSLFIQAPSVDATMLQDGCIARPSLFMPNVIPKGAYQAKSIYNGDLSDDSVDNRVLATGAAVANLGYTPVNKAGDSAIGALQFNNDDVIGITSFVQGAITVTSTAANANNAGYMPAIGFHRPGVVGRSIGLQTNGRLLAPVANSATQYYLLDSLFGVANADIQAGAITYDKLAQSLINIICPIGMVIPFAGVSPAGYWHVCDGAWISRTTYSALFAQLGTYWGAGDGVNSFTLPNFINRVPVGYGSGGAWGFGTYGGETVHQLVMSEIPYHDHNWAQSPHDHGTHAHNYTTMVGAGSGLASGPNWAVGAATTTASGVPASNANITFNGQGSSYGHNNMPPFGVLYWLIKLL